MLVCVSVVSLGIVNSDACSETGVSAVNSSCCLLNGVGKAAFLLGMQGGEELISVLWIVWPELGLQRARTRTHTHTHTHRPHLHTQCPMGAQIVLALKKLAVHIPHTENINTPHLVYLQPTCRGGAFPEL